MRKRKRVALFANGWAREFLLEIGYGVCQCAEEMDADIFAFVNYSVHVSAEEEQKGEFNIFCLPDLKDFDGVLLLTNSFNLLQERDYLYREVQRAAIPAISLESELEGIGFFGSDNYSGMCELTEHMIKEHGVRNILLIGGIRGHADSDTRVRAVLDTAERNQIRIRQEDILYGSWSDGEAALCLAAWLKENKTLPDAIICANDIMAIGVCDWLEEHGYRVPEDVKVTGYDCIARGQEHSPVITSINREWTGMGYRALRVLLDQIEGRETPARTMVESRLVCGTSCGCRAEDAETGERPDLGRVADIKRIDGVASDQHFRHMYTSVRKTETIEEAHEALSGFFRKECWMEGEDFMLCIHPGFFIVADDDDIYKMPGYSEEMDVICALRDGVPEEYKRIPKKEAMFRAAERKEKAGVYIFVPVRSDDKNFGFAMLSRNLDIANDCMLYIWTRHVNQYMEQIRSNVKIAELTRKLRELSVTDMLTGLYNRMGCEKILYPFLAECQERGGRGVMLLVDVDRMKTINDRYGHTQGDLALQIVAYVLKTALPEGFLASRFGGDEFLVAGENDETVSIGEMARHLAGKLAEEVRLRKIDFPLTISIGGVRMERGEVFRLKSCLQRADEAMYRVKEWHHRQIDGGNNVETDGGNGTERDSVNNAETDDGNNAATDGGNNAETDGGNVAATDGRNATE